jgi:predicted amidohydrolase
MEPWTGACLQTKTISLAAPKTPSDVRAAIIAGIDRFDRLIADSLAAGPSDLFLLPEKALGDREEDLRGCIEFPGPEIEHLQAVAQKHGVFLGANAYTLSADFPGRYFNTSFLLNRSGDIVLKSYRLHTYHSTSPHDFWERFLDKVGLDGAFPVARTELGNIAMLPSMELMYPEIARLFVLRGAEVLLHTTMEKIVDRSTKRTRAAENMAYLLSANISTHVGADEFMDVGSLIVNWRGQVLAGKNQGEEGTCSALIDIGSLRSRRANPDIQFPEYGVNYLSRLRTEIAATGYSAATIYPVDTYKENTVVHTAISPETGNTENLMTALGNMAKAGMLPA